MQKKISKIEASPQLKRKLKVCAYARVSSGKDAMLHSLSAQVSYYNKLIQQNDKWLFVGVYSDEAITGTRSSIRNGFNEMLKECRAGNIDLIITKSISRFARNIVTMLEVVRELKKLNIDVFFEEQNIHTISEEGELILTFLASFAQEEARSMSENMKWRVKKNFEEGLVWGRAPYGYKVDNGKFVIIPYEAEAIKIVFEMYLSGIGVADIARTLDNKGFIPRCEGKWSRGQIRNILKQYIYTGNVVLQTTYSENYITKKSRKNKGEKLKYHVEDAHEPIISLADFIQAQKIMQARIENYDFGCTPKENAFRGKLICNCCGGKYQLKRSYKKLVWICYTYNAFGISRCESKRVPDAELVRLAKEILKVEELTNEIINERIEKVVVSNGRLLTFYLSDGRIIDATWTERSRRESWTPEMRENARRRELERNGKGNSYTTNN